MKFVIGFLICLTSLSSFASDNNCTVRTSNSSTAASSVEEIVLKKSQSLEFRKGNILGTIMTSNNRLILVQVENTTDYNLSAMNMHTIEKFKGALVLLQDLKSGDSIEIECQTK